MTRMTKENVARFIDDEAAWCLNDSRARERMAELAFAVRGGMP